MKIRTLILSAAIFLPLLGGAYWFFWGEGADWKARTAFEEGNWKASEQQLIAVEKQIPPAEFALYEGYIAREQGNLAQSSAAFEKALAANPQLRLREEILINLAYNGFLTRQTEPVQRAIKMLERKRSIWNPFLNALYAFLRNGNEENLKALQEIAVPPPLSPWMDKAFATSFSPIWFAKQNALTLIEEGNTVQARQQLEKFSRTAVSEDKEEINYLTGLSYLKEAKERPPLAATPYYKLAFSYFDRIPFQDSRFQPGREAAFAQIEEEISSLIAEGHYDNLPFYAAVVEKWGSKAIQERLSSTFEAVQRANWAEIQNALFETLSIATEEKSPNGNWNEGLQTLYWELAQKAFAEGKLNEAEEQLKAALQITPAPQAFLKAILPLSAQILWRKGDPYDAVLAWNKSFALQPLDAIDRIDYGKALMEVQRFDLAIKQFRFMEQYARLSLPEELSLIESLIQAGHFDEGKERALEVTPKLDGKEALQLSSIVFPLNDKMLEEKIAQQIPPKEKWDEELKMAAFQTALERGEYDAAARLYASEKSLLNKSGSGQFLLAKFYSQVGNPKMALKYASEARVTNPELPKVAQFIEQHTLDPEGLGASLALTEKALQSDPSSLSLLLQKGQTLIDLSIASQDKSSLPISKMPYLRTAYALLQDLSDKGQEFPFYHFLYGLSSFLLDEDETAAKSFEKAIQLSPGFADAAKYLALVYAREGKGNEAAKVLLTALKYHPADGEGWQVLADIYTAGGEGLEAGYALENALKFRPNNINTLLSVAKYKLELQNPQAAQEFVEKALKINPQNQNALLLKIQILNNPLLTERESISEIKKKLDQTLETLRKVNPSLTSKIQKELQKS